MWTNWGMHKIYNTVILDCVFSAPATAADWVQTSRVEVVLDRHYHRNNHCLQNDNKIIYSCRYNICLIPFQPVDDDVLLGWRSPIEITSSGLRNNIFATPSHIFSTSCWISGLTWNVWSDSQLDSQAVTPSKSFRRFRAPVRLENKH